MKLLLDLNGKNQTIENLFESWNFLAEIFARNSASFWLATGLERKSFLRKTKKERSTDIGEMLLLQQMWDFWPWPDDMRNVSHLFPPSPLHFVSPQSCLLLRSRPMKIEKPPTFYNLPNNISSFLSFVFIVRYPLKWLILWERTKDGPILSKVIDKLLFWFYLTLCRD